MPDCLGDHKPRLVSFASFPPADGHRHAGGRLYCEHIRIIAKYFDVSAVCPATQANRKSAANLLPGVNLTLIPIDSLSIAERRPIRALRAFACGLVPNRGLQKGLTNRLELQRALSEADLVEIQWEENLPLVGIIRRLRPCVPVTLYVHDVVSQRAAREAALARGITAAALHILHLQARRAERRLLSLIDIAIVLSEKDRTLLSPVRSASPEIIVCHPPPRGAVPGQLPHPGRRLLFVGAMERPANDDAVCWFIERVWSRVHKVCPTATFVVAGSSPTKNLRALAAKTPGVEIAGHLPNLEPEFQRARAFVAPLRLGAGVKLKVLDAIASGVPVVATTVASEGIVDVVGREAFAAITDEPLAMAEALVSVLVDDQFNCQVAEQGIRALSRAYDSSSSMLYVARRYLELCAT